MRNIPVQHVHTGQTVGKTMYDNNWNPMLREGVALQENHIRWLNENGYASVYIHDDIPLEDAEFVISEQLYLRGLQLVSHAFTIMRKIMHIEEENTDQKNLEMMHLYKERDQQMEDILEWSTKSIHLMIRQKIRQWPYPVIKNRFGYPIHHAICTGLLCTLIGIEMKMNINQLRSMFVASILSEIGNLVIPHSILHKQGKLTAEEFEIVKGHCKSGYIHIKSCPDLHHLIRLICLEHHERVDGTGYPNNLKEFEINAQAKVMAVADAYDALTSDRPYRPAYPPHKTLDIIRNGVGKQYSVDVVDALQKAVAFFPVGWVVSLDNEQYGVVVETNPETPARPRVKLLEGHQFSRVLDLCKEPCRYIIGIKYISL